MKILNFKIKIFLILFAAIFTFALVNGCKDSAVTTQADNLDYSYKSASDTTDTGILTIEWVKLLIKDIKLQASTSSEDSVSFKVGPYVLYLDLTSQLTIVGTAYIPAGTYNKVRFMVHKLENTEPIPDPYFADSLGRYSVIVKGKYLGVDFIYKSTKSAHQKLTSKNSLQVSPSGKSNITLWANPYIWFIKNGMYLDPADPLNANDIDNNIKDNINNNFKVFLDNDRNGQPD